ncbi:hypothetical protein GCM10017557_14250 [Streptomyces aurantiacus]|uniref:Uncharacterized protein n=1 Tax=Streptomyces aurantiacus TaxID=47760 RepID=A0A7G1NYF8_9ACTN|nr:hypothetical protein GCM10017557_14250 [Streptomyces aurantiacus]
MPMVPRPMTATVLSSGSPDTADEEDKEDKGDKREVEGSDRGVAIAGLQE